MRARIREGAGVIETVGQTLIRRIANMVTKIWTKICIAGPVCIMFLRLMPSRHVRQSDKLHRFFIDNIDDGAFLIENGKIQDVSKVGTELFGYSREELIGQSPYFVVSQRCKEIVHRRVREGNEEPYESEGQRKDGSTFPVYVRGRELIYEGRSVRLTTVRDITEQKRTEGTLRKLMRAVEQSPNAIFITNTDGAIEYINAKFTDMTGYTAEDIIGQNPRILQSKDTPREVYADLWKTIQSGHEWRYEIKDKRKDGSCFWADSTIAPVKDDNGAITHYIATHDDITRRKNAEQDACEAQEKAEIANRAKSDLLANMSHELRTPLNAIIGFSETIKEEVFGPLGNDKYREYLSDIHHSGQHLLELINDILDVSAIEAGAMELYDEEVNLADIVDVAIRMIKPRAVTGKVTVFTTIDSEMPGVIADERRIKQVLLNILSNAVKFTPEGGDVLITATLRDDGALDVVVKDTGVGMDDVEVNKALSTFGQVDSGLDRKHEGTGLGLPLTVGLMELHGGFLRISSAKNIGTSIIISFPPERVIPRSMPIQPGSQTAKATK